MEFSKFGENVVILAEGSEFLYVFGGIFGIFSGESARGIIREWIRIWSEEIRGINIEDVERVVRGWAISALMDLRDEGS